MSRLLATFLLLLLPLSLAAQPAAPVEGTDYVRIEGGQRWQPEPGTIEVVEVFAYACGVCDRFAPMLADWARKAAPDVRVHYVPAAFDLGDAYARAYFALDSLGQVREHHGAIFDAIHRTGMLPGRGASQGELAGFLASQGLPAAQVGAAMRSEATDKKMNAAREFAVRSGLHGTPTLIINGRYRVQGRSLQDVLRIADALVAMERAVSR